MLGTITRLAAWYDVLVGVCTTLGDWHEVVPGQGEYSARLVAIAALVLESIDLCGPLCFGEWNAQDSSDGGTAASALIGAGLWISGHPRGVAGLYAL